MKTEKIQSMIEDGFAIKRISIILNLPVKDIKDLISKEKWALKKEPFNDGCISRIVDLYEAGCSAKSLGLKFNIDKRRIQKWAKENGFLRNKNDSHRFFELNQQYFDVIDTPEKAYWLGFLFADGYNNEDEGRVTLSLQLSDKDHIEKFCKAINSNAEGFNVTDDKGHRKFGVKLNSTHMSASLAKIGCVQAKSLIVKYPEINPNLNFHFIRGLFDGDGCLTFRKSIGEWKFSIAGTKEITTSISNLFSLKDINSTLSHISKENKNTYELQVSGNRQIASVFPHLYKDADPEIYMIRKHSKFKDLDIFLGQPSVANRSCAKLTNSEIQEIIQKFGEGQSADVIAVQYKRHVRTINKIKHDFFNKNLSVQTSLFYDPIKIEGNILTGFYLRTLSRDQKEALVEPIFHYFRNQGWVYPDTSQQLNSEFERIVKTKINSSNEELNNNGSVGTSVCKFFCHSFYKSSERHGKNVIETWEDDALFRRVIRNRLILDWKSKDSKESFAISPANLVTGMRSMRLVLPVSMFKPDIAKYICERYSEPGDLVGDYSCGFGARLLGAVASNRRYIGTDPLTVPELERMVDFFGFKDVTLIKSGSESYCGDENSADLYWSSPPYFDQEYYSSDASQSYNQGEIYFYDNYWKNTLKNVKYMLKPNKWFGLNVHSRYTRMIQMAKDVFGEPEEILYLKSSQSHLGSANIKSKLEPIFMFKNKK